MSTFLCLHLHRSHLRVRFLTESPRFLWCDACHEMR